MERNHSSSVNNQQETNGTNLADESLNDESNGVESGDESSLEVSIDEEEDKEEEDDEEAEEDEEEEDEEEEVQQPETNNHKPVVVHKINQYNNKLGSTSKEVLEHIDEAIDNVVKHFTVSKSDLLEASTSRSTGSRPAHHNNSSATKSANKTKPRKRKRKRRSNSFNHFGLDNDDFPFELGSSRKKKQPDKSVAGKKDAGGGDVVGPFVRVEKRKHQINYVVVNSSSKLEDKDNKFTKPNYSSIVRKSSDQVLFKPNDPTWICVFCKRAPHFKQLGDLYGPHELITEKPTDSTNSTSFSQTNQSPSTNQHNHNSPANSAPPPETRNEIWYHEDCVIWSNGIYLAGNRVRNIDEIVLECCDIVSLHCFCLQERMTHFEWFKIVFPNFLFFLSSQDLL